MFGKVGATEKNVWQTEACAVCLQALISLQTHTDKNQSAVAAINHTLHVSLGFSFPYLQLPTFLLPGFVLIVFFYT